MMETKPAKSKAWRYCRNNGYFLKIAFQTTPMYLIGSGILRVIGGFRATFLSVYFLAYIVASVEERKGLEEVLAFSAVSFLLVAASFCCQAAFESYWKPIYQERLTCSLQRKVFRQTRRLDMSVYDSEDFYTTVALANRECKERMVSVVESALNLVENLAELASIIGYSMTVDRIVPAIGILSFAMSCAMNRKLAGMRVYYDYKRMEKEKEEAVFRRIFYLPEYAKEVRLTNIRELLMKRYRNLLAAKEALVRKEGAGIGRLTALKTILCTSLCVDFLAPLYLTFRMLVWKSMRASGFLGVLNGCVQLQLKLDALSDGISAFRQNGAFIEYFRRFEDMPCTIETGEAPDSARVPDSGGIRDREPFRCLEVKGVGFGYEADRPVLQGIDLCIRKGQKVAIVGRNGSGKTSLVKLLLRLYDPQEGEIRYNGKRLQEMRTAEYRNGISAMFQDFCVYETSILKNITMEARPDMQRVREALSRVGLLGEIPDLDRRLGSELSERGISMSGGQLQRLALARVIYEDRDFLVMDEPTSALDILFEKDFYDLVYEHLKEKTILFVSHRLSSVTACDLILYMEQGRIVERGSHKELMELGGGYAALFRAATERFIYQ